MSVRRITRQSFVKSTEPQQDANQQARAKAIGVLERLLDTDKAQRVKANAGDLDKACFLLSQEQRWALHVAVGTLRKTEGQS